MLAYNSREILGEIRKYMFVHDITQDDLANLMGKSKQNLSNIFQNANPTLQTTFAILDALNLAFDYNLVDKDLVASKKTTNEYSYEADDYEYYFDA